MNFDQQIKQSPGYSGASNKIFIYESVATKLKKKKKDSALLFVLSDCRRIFKWLGEYSNDLANEL